LAAPQQSDRRRAAPRHPPGQVFTANSASGASGWPWAGFANPATRWSGDWWRTPPIKGFEWCGRAARAPPLFALRPPLPPPAFLGPPACPDPAAAALAQPDLLPSPHSTPPKVRHLHVQPAFGCDLQGLHLLHLRHHRRMVGSAGRAGFGGTCMGPAWGGASWCGARPLCVAFHRRRAARAARRILRPPLQLPACVHLHRPRRWLKNSPAAFRMLSHSDVFKPGKLLGGAGAHAAGGGSFGGRVAPRSPLLTPAPLTRENPSHPAHALALIINPPFHPPDKTMMVTKGIRAEGFDTGTCTADGCSGNSLFRLDRTTAGSSWQFNWEGACPAGDGRVGTGWSWEVGGPAASASSAAA
jgi:hypothetical protein